MFSQFALCDLVAVFILNYGVFSGVFYSYWIRKQVFFEVFSSVFYHFLREIFIKFRLFLCVFYALQMPFLLFCISKIL